MCYTEIKHLWGPNVLVQTPIVLHSFNPAVPEVCWRRTGDRGMLAHIFWFWPQDQGFWNIVQNVLELVLEVSLPHDPLHYLLSISKSYKKLSAHILTAARRLIPHYWKSTETSSQSQLILVIAEVGVMEYLTALLRDSIKFFHKIWNFWDKLTNAHAWKSPSVSYYLTKQKISWIMSQEKISNTILDTLEKFKHIWDPWARRIGVSL